MAIRRTALTRGAHSARLWGLVALPAIALIGLAATPASAESINLLSSDGALQMLDDNALADIRGRGAEAGEVGAADNLAVILWDELGSGQQGQKSGGQVQRSSATGVQMNSLVAQRY